MCRYQLEVPAEAFYTWRVSHVGGYAMRWPVCQDKTESCPEKSAVLYLILYYCPIIGHVQSLIRSDGPLSYLVY